MNNQRNTNNLSPHSSPCQAPLPENTPVPAELFLSRYIYINKGYINTKERTTRQGHPSKLLEPMPSPGKLLRKYDQIYPILKQLLGSPKRAEMVKAALRLQACSRHSFASAKYLAAAGLGSEKTWDRCLAQLRKLGLVDTIRTNRLNGQQSVNLLDLRKLWKYIQKLLIPITGLFQTVRGVPWVKIHGAWAPANQLHLPGEPSS